MRASDLPDLRRVARTKAVTYSGHAIDQMLSRGITTDDVEEILESNTNQLIEVQSPSIAPGKKHRNERDLIYDPNHKPDAIIVMVLLFNPSPEIRVVTVEMPSDETWNHNPGADPALTHK